MDYKLNGKTALVLGASRGLGAAISLMLAKEGVKVTSVARNTSNIEEWSKNFSIVPFKSDLTDANSLGNLINFLTDKHIDILVNNCGGPIAGPANGQKIEVWEKAFKSMASPMFSITNELLPKMVFLELPTLDVKGRFTKNGFPQATGV